MTVEQPVSSTSGDLLSGLALPQGGKWIQTARHDALSRTQAMGLPIRRDEYWKFTDPRSLTQADTIRSDSFEAADQAGFQNVDQLRIVFVDGRFDADASDDLMQTGLEIERLEDVAKADIHWAQDVFGALEAKGQSPVARPLASFNTATASDGILIRATGKVERPVSIVYLHEDAFADANLHHAIKVESGGEVTVLESGPAAARLNTVMEIDVAPGATFHHVRLQGRDHNRRAATHMFARLGEESTYKSFTLTANGVLTRNEQVVEFVGDNGVAHVAGAALGDGDFHHDDTVFVTHDAVACESRQVFKKVLRNGATGVFQGKILVQPGAQQTDGYQISQSLLLDDDSQFLAKPELEIYADDVACSHGSTSGAIDEDALFYLKSRGVPTGEAQDLLVLAFLAEAIDEVENAALAEDILARLQAWLARHRT